MNKFNRFLSRYREAIMAVIDIIIVVFSYWLAYFIRTDFGRLSFFMGEASLWSNMIWVILINLITILAFGLNRSLWMYVSVDEALRVSAAVGTGNFIWWLLVMITKIPEYTRSIPVIAAMIQLILMLGLRLVYRIVRRDGAQRKRQHRALILGAGSAGVNALREITSSDRYDTRIVGFLDKNPKKVKKRLNGIEVLGTDDEIEEIVKQYDIDTAYIAIKNISKEDLKVLIEKCRNLNLRTRIVAFELHANAYGLTTSVRNVSINDLLGRGELNLNTAEIGNYLTGKTIMVTGAGGSIGSELVRQIMTFAPKRFVLVDIYENNMYDLQQEINIDRRTGSLQTTTDVVCLIGSVRDKNRINDRQDRYRPRFMLLHHRKR